MGFRSWVLGGFVAASLVSSSAHAVKFANQFIEFELPPQWQCSLEGAEWVCQSTNEQKKRDAIIVLAAKLKGDQDSLDQYLTHLKAAKTYSSVAGKPVKSDPKYARTENISGQPWVDALHLESEIPGFYTRYLATVKQDIGVLVTYSINKNKYQDYLGDFETMVKTLKVFRKPGGINVAPASANLFQNTQIPTGLAETTVFPGISPQGGSDAESAQQVAGGGESGGGQGELLFYLLLGAGAIGFILWRRRNSAG